MKQATGVEIVLLKMHLVVVKLAQLVVVSPGKSNLTTTKCILNSTISTPSARFITLDIKSFYYNTPMGRYEYMKISLAILPEETSSKLHQTDGYTWRSAKACQA